MHRRGEDEADAIQRQGEYESRSGVRKRDCSGGEPVQRYESPPGSVQFPECAVVSGLPSGGGLFT
ncbi:hypothetical protein [uncultured Roseibium sp.]|uniref:hypothetical protein n=1 Tax=uncultured Roseibium sp. TaxID=1936171 RepID=UPI00261AE4F0|nr:hypothetical protein [uncultured Roseibium sp.]